MAWKWLRSKKCTMYALLPLQRLAFLQGIEDDYVLAAWNWLALPVMYDLLTTNLGNVSSIADMYCSKHKSEFKPMKCRFWETSWTTGLWRQIPWTGPQLTVLACWTSKRDPSSDRHSSVPGISPDFRLHFHHLAWDYAMLPSLTWFKPLRSSTTDELLGLFHTFSGRAGLELPLSCFATARSISPHCNAGLIRLADDWAPRIRPHSLIVVRRYIYT